MYPKLAKYMKEKKYDEVPIMEMYDVPNKVINYIAPVRVKTEVFESFLTAQLPEH